MFKTFRRKRLKKKPFPTEWLNIIQKNVPLYSHLPQDLQNDLLNHIKIFINEKKFEGCDGLVMTDEIKVTISAQACILLLNRKTDYYAKLISILVYPTTFINPHSKQNNAGVTSEKAQPTLGLSFLRGTVILAWDNALHGCRYLHDGDNLIFHEFAHQLDAQDFVYNGTPLLATQSQYMTWAKTLGDHFETMVENIQTDKENFLDEYGATSPAEFFAVATEYFFEKPIQMKDKQPKLYAELENFYHQDPCTYYA